MIAGFVIGEDDQTVNIFARASEISGQVAGTLGDPKLTINVQATGEELGTNDNWEDTQGQEIMDIWGGAQPVTAGSTSSGIILTLPTGAYTATVEAADGTSTGVALVEVFEVD